MASGNHLHNLGSELLRMEKEEPAVRREAASYKKMVENLKGGSLGLSPDELARLYDVETPLCAFGSCTAEATHAPCCSSHGHPLCCECYRTTHFVETGPCH